MEKYLLLAIIALALTGTGLFLNQEEATVATNNNLYHKFVQWKSANNKNYNGQEDQLRFAVFQANNEYIEEWNAKGSSMVLGLNVFADLTNEEYSAKYLTLKNIQEETGNGEIVPPAKDDATVIDWVKGGAVAPVENQGNCGSCWAFSATGALTGLNYIQNKELTVFSKQQLVSCDKVDHGCRGGHPVNAFINVRKNGISTEAQYPYEQFKDEHTHACQQDLIKPVFKNKGLGRVRSRDVKGMLQNLENQPLSIAVGASALAFQLYRKGTILHSGCPARLDHAILLVGVNLSASEADQKYWTVKNSWGVGWGDNGYAKILYEESGNGVCGINKDVSYPN